MPLNRDEKARIQRLAAQMAKRYARKPVPGVSLVKAPVTKAASGGTLTVNLQGAELAIPYTTAASTAKTGDTVLVLAQPGMAIAVGIIAT